ncbi:MAG TPA: SDR family oxidoreductase [Burkholderiaceae bacterium]|nr:SDR family oxidoreductase [Burkholderiaceae bacterium]
MILVVGGSGLLGSLITRQLLAAGASVRVMTRNPLKATSLQQAGAEVVAGDLVDDESLSRACAGADRVVAAAHSLFGRGRHASARVDGTGHRRLIETAKAHGVGKFVYTSAYFPSPAFQTIPFVRIKREIEQYVRASGLNYTILRPTAFMDFHAHVLMGKPVLAGKKLVMFGEGEKLRNFVAASDVAALAVRALQDDALAGESIDIGGPENLTDMDVVRTYERVSGRKAKVMHLSLRVPRTLAQLVRPFHSGLSQVLQLASLMSSTEQQFDARPLQQRYAIQLTRLEEFAREQSAHYKADVAK